jgi:V8-like Glu-specific endopeptidase
MAPTLLAVVGPLRWRRPRRRRGRGRGSPGVDHGDPRAEHRAVADVGGNDADAVACDRTVVECCGLPNSDADPPTPVTIPTAHHFSGMPTVGPLFPSATATRHGCTASVIDSPAGNLLLTAAHCVSGRYVGTVFAPGYDAGKEPYGLWTVIAVHGATGWLKNHDTQNDYAFLVVGPRTINGKVTQIQDVTGGNQLGNAAVAGETVTVPAYARGSDDQPLTCTIKVYLDDGFPAFNCNPYPGGTSGSPWLVSTAHGDVVVGVIGGLHQGGCHTYTSYSSAFSTTTWRTYATSAEGLPTTPFPGSGSNGC